MTRWGKWAVPWFRPIAVGAVVAALGVAGCGKKAPPAQTGTTEAAGTTQAAANTDSTQPAGTQSAGSQPAPAPGTRDRLHQSFADATRGPDDPPDQTEKPPDKTMTGMPTFKVFEGVKEIWDTIRFVDAAGKPVRYTAVLETDFGTVEIELKHELAPNHVRNFIALAKVGYYDGLLFDRIKHEEQQDSDGKVLHVVNAVEGGCPLGLGEDFSGSVGYWLKPEPSDAHHEPGTVGACRGPAPDSAATRFYITLDEAPVLDEGYAVFGKVKKDNLDVLRRIALQPTIKDDSERDGRHRPEKKIVIKKVTIKVEVPAQI